MKIYRLIAILVTFAVSACGPDKDEIRAQLRAELNAVEGEMTAVGIAMRQQTSAMNQAEAEAFFGSFAAGYGLTSGDYRLAGEGAIAASDAARQYDVSSYSLDQLRSRYLQLGKRQMQLRVQLK